jgi:hypothetical protein
MVFFVARHHSRPDGSFLWITNPLKTIQFILWKNYKGIIIQLASALLLAVFIGLFFYNVPGATVNKVFGV